jgi:predicted transcriptional regulator
MAVVGTARLAGTTGCSPDTSWRHHHRDFGLSRDEYDAYLDGAANAYLLHLTAVNRLTKPLPLRHLREQTPFQPRRACATSLLRTRRPALVDALRSAGLAREGEAAMV